MDKVLAALYLLGICCSLGLGAEVNFSLEDEDGSADDEDFSGSGLGVIVPSAFDDVEKEHSEPLAPLAPTAVQDFTENVTALVLVEATTKSQDGDLQKINEPGLSVEIPAVGPSSHTTTHRPTSTAAVATESSDAFDHHPHHGGHHHHHHHHHPKTTTDSNVHQESTTQGQHVHKPHEHHIPDPVVTTSHPKEHHPFQKTTTPGPAKDAGFVYHHVHHHEGSASTPYADKEEATADPTDPALVGFDVNPTTEPSDDLHKLHKQTTATSFLVDGSNVHHVLHGKITTSPPRNDEEDRAEFTTSTPKDADSDVLVHHGGDKTTSPSSHVHHVHQDTTPSGVDKHGRRHHHHHHPHHHTTTTASTEQTTGSDEQHGLHTLNPIDNFVVSTTVTNAVVPVVNEDLNIPEDSEPKQTTENSPVERSTHHPEDKDPLVPDENDVDLFDSKEDEVSGDGAEVNNDLFFEKTSSDVKSEAIDRSSAVDGEGSSDASHGIMERKELLAGIIAGGAVGLIFAGFLVGFVLYRMKKKDEGSYSLEEPKQSNGGYQKPREQREFYA